jgi:hypothetical protein
MLCNTDHSLQLQADCIVPLYSNTFLQNLSNIEDMTSNSPYRRSAAFSCMYGVNFTRKMLDKIMYEGGKSEITKKLYQFLSSFL